jgi:hypothetical protein
MGMYHWESNQEDFLVLSGNGLLLIEGHERPLRKWDLVHCPPKTKHIILGAGDEPSSSLPSELASCATMSNGAATPSGSWRRDTRSEYRRDVRRNSSVCRPTAPVLGAGG